MTSSFLDLYKAEIVHLVEGTLNEGFIVPDEELYFDLSIGRIYLDVSNQKLGLFDVDTDQTHLLLHNS